MTHDVSKFDRVGERERTLTESAQENVSLLAWMMKLELGEKTAVHRSGVMSI